MRILIAEDDPASARYMQGLLSKIGECTVTSDGKQALEAFSAAYDENKPYDLVCLDIMMPRMDGQEALERLRALENERGIKPSLEVKVIMTTALGDVRSVMGAYKTGATAYVTKPIDPQKLLETIRSLGLVG